MSHTVLGSSIDSSAMDTPEVQKLAAAKMGISFDGRYFRYRVFRYDKLSDAMNYAQIDAGRGFRPEPTRPDVDWLPRPTQSDADIALMKQFSVTFQGNRFAYGGYRYDRLSDAVDYARLDSADVHGLLQLLERNGE
jgi:hypothetical protein